MDQIPEPTPPFVTTRQLAAEFCVTTATIKRWRLEGQGPPWVRMGRSIRYQRADVDAWSLANKHRTRNPKKGQPS